MIANLYRGPLDGMRIVVAPTEVLKIVAPPIVSETVDEEGRRSPISDPQRAVYQVQACHRDITGDLIASFVYVENEPLYMFDD